MSKLLNHPQVKPLLSDEQVGPLWWRPKLAGFSESHA